MRKGDIFIAIVFCLSVSSCRIFNFDYWAYKAQPTYEYHFEKYEPYLSIDSTYKTAEEKVRFETLKKHFIETWLSPYQYKEGDTLKMKMYMSRGFRNYIEPENCYFNDKANGFGDYSLLNFYIDNILHTKQFDTLLILVTTVEVIPDSLMNALHIDRKKDSGKRARAIPMKVIVDSKGNWQFACLANTFGLMTDDVEEKGINELKRSLKRTLIRGSYLKSDLTPDPTFWSRLFNDPAIFFPDPEKEGFPLN